ncbi:UNVERIFIED_CONTAM: hypothetical protein HHA_227890 [Hammondia hammondi]|eukprot:XP_008882134.1 hypothetical protein HHA_227890 [Hammondia hammondi]
MEFPAFRSPEWMASAFAPVSPTASSSASQTAATAAAERPQAAEGKTGEKKEGATSPAFAPLVPPSFCFRGFEPVPAYLASFPTAGLYVQRVQQVKWTIKRALFRQSLFKIQNVEVLEMKRCRQPRRLVASEIHFDAERERRWQLSGASSPLAASSADASAHALSAAETPAVASAASPSFSSVTERLRRWRRDNHRDEETLREEIWKVDRCGSLRDYRIIVSRDRATKDFFTVSVQPVAWSDWLRQKYFNFVDKTVQAEE